MKKQSKCFVAPIPTSEGCFLAAYSERGLCRLEFPSDRDRASSPLSPLPDTISRWHAGTVAALNRVLTGQNPTELPPLDLSSGTAFQQQVWRALQAITAGKTRSYGEVARAIGKPKALRAVGGACGANPIPVLIPCHRVLAAGGKIGGFSSDPKWKRLLLEREGVSRQKHL